MTESAYFRLSNRLQRGIASTLKWSEFRPVQDLTIEAVFAGKNVIVLAPTAGGKTEAAFFPTLDRLYLDSTSSVGCIYVSPLRALLNNQEGRIEELSRLVGLRAFKWHGDVGGGSKKRFLANPANILMTTPESLEVLLMSGRAAEYDLFAHVKFIVIDEIHAFAADDRGAHLMSLLERIQKASSVDIQRIGLSATVGNPDDISVWLQGTSKRKRCVVDPPKGRVQRKIVIRYTNNDSEEATAEAAVLLTENRKALFFTQGRAATERVRTAFSSRGAEVFVHHSSVSRELREEAEAKFMHSRGTATMISTSTLELGIDVGDLNLVLQLDAPSTVSSFLQRLGRTGRRPGEIQHMEFFTNRESLLQAVAIVNLARRGFVEDVVPSRSNLPVLLHQILAKVVERTVIRREDLWLELEGPESFRDIGRDVFDAIVNHLTRKDILVDLDHRIALGDEGERTFGGMNFFNLYAVFETAAEVTVKTRDGRVVGALETMFVRRMQDKTFIFLLAGRTWIAVDVDLPRKLVIAEPFLKGEAPKWHGAGGFLSQEITEEMRNILISSDEYPFVDNRGREEIRSMRKELSSLLRKDRCPITTHSDKVRVTTYAGGKINATIAALLERQNSIIEVSGFGDLDIELKSPSGGLLSAGLARMEILKIRTADETLNKRDLATLVSDRDRDKLAKFQPYLPTELEGSFLAERLFDIENTCKLARESEFIIL